MSELFRWCIFSRHFFAREKDARSFSTLHAIRERKGIFSEEVNSSSDEIGHSLPSKLSLCLAFLARFYLEKKEEEGNASFAVSPLFVRRCKKDCC